MLGIRELIGAVSCMLRVQDSNSCAGRRFSRSQRGRSLEEMKGSALRSIFFFMPLLASMNLGSCWAKSWAWATGELIGGGERRVVRNRLSVG